MTREDFDHLWRTSFLPFARKLSTRFRLVSFRPTQKEVIWEKFRTVIDQLRRDYFGRPAVLDRHKFASIFTAVVLDVAPFRTPHPEDNKKRPLDVGQFTANEAWAWYCAQQIVLLMIDRYAQGENIEVLRKVYENGFLEPPCGGASYDEQVVKSLYLARARDRFDEHGFIHLLYMLEVYTAQVRKNMLEDAVGA